MDDALLMRVLHRLADGDEQLQPLRRGVSLASSQNFVSGRPLTSSMTKNGWPPGVRPPSSTRAMLGWSIIARACRSCSNRASTALESMPVLISFSATLRLTGSVCLATQTSPMPAFADLLLERVAAGDQHVREGGRVVVGRDRGLPEENSSDADGLDRAFRRWLVRLGPDFVGSLVGGQQGFDPPP